MAGRFSTEKLVLSALPIVLVCMATVSVRVPTPGIGGYIHPGDVIVTLCGVFLGPASTFLVIGVGSCMADLLKGCSVYTPITFAIKGLAAFSASHVCRSLRARGINLYTTVAGCGVTNIVLVVGGCCVCEAFLYGLDATLTNVPSNIIQGISGLTISSALYPVLQRPLSMTLKA